MNIIWGINCLLSFNSLNKLRKWLVLAAAVGFSLTINLPSVTLLILATFLSYKYTKNEAAWIGFGIGATVGISKEIYDMRYGYSDENDLYADLLGAALGSITIRINLNKRKKNQIYYVRD